MYSPDIDRVELIERTSYPDFLTVQYDFGMIGNSEGLKIAYELENNKGVVSINTIPNESGDIVELEFTLLPDYRKLTRIKEYIESLKERLIEVYAERGLNIEVVDRIGETYFGTPA